MSRRLSLQLKNSSKQKPKVKFTDELIFLESIKDNDIDCVRNMLRRASANIDLNKINDTGLTALHQAVLENSVDLVNILIENKADLNILDEDHWTPLHAAASMGYHEISKILLENGADVNCLTAENERPIDLVDQDDFPLISLLLNYMNLNSSSNDSTNSSDENEPDNSDLYRKIVLNILRNYDDNDQIFQEIEKLGDQKFVNSFKFQKSLCIAICEASINKNDLDKQELRKRLGLLLKYSDRTIDYELNLIDSVYDFIRNSEVSTDMFKKIITIFNELKLITNNAYQIWRSKEKNLDKKKFGFNLKN
ncbi:unnamed protein product [Brachionus calyciflorus]|uniref:Uncharacterized protein n=1 Tax=Brachionus calyciflorus TaxID=104777 RepID=A0A813PJL6_9BILA|nr:unnamed protein product [Brachionus calyciflorus]